MQPQTQTQPRPQKLLTITYDRTPTPHTINNTTLPYIKSIQTTLNPTSTSKQIPSSHTQLCSFSTIGMNKKGDQSATIRVNQDIQYLHFMMVSQNGGGQSYRSDQTIIVADSKEYLWQCAGWYFQDGHRIEDCENINDGECDCEKEKEMFVDELKYGGFATCDFISSKIQDGTFQIYSVKI